MVNAQAMLLDHLGVDKLLAAVGGSMGGMQVLEWAVSHPERVHLCVPIATAARQPTQAIAFNEVGRQAIMADPDWNGGHYYGGKPPSRGLGVARMVGHITYLSDEAMQEKFGRRLRDIHDYSFTFSADFEVESYLRHQGLSFTEPLRRQHVPLHHARPRLLRPHAPHGTLVQAFRDVTSRFLVLAFSSDWLHPPYQLKEIVSALRATHKHVSYYEVESHYGHDAFLLEREKMEGIIAAFLASGARTLSPRRGLPCAVSTTSSSRTSCRTAPRSSTWPAATGSCSPSSSPTRTCAAAASRSPRRPSRPASARACRCSTATSTPAWPTTPTARTTSSS